MLHSKNTEQLKADTEGKEGGKQETVAACRGSQVEEQSQCPSFYQQSCRSSALLGKSSGTKHRLGPALFCDSASFAEGECLKSDLKR